MVNIDVLPVGDPTVSPLSANRTDGDHEAGHRVLWRESAEGVPPPDGAGQRRVRPAHCHRVLAQSAAGRAHSK